MSMTAGEALEYIVAELGLGYAEGPVNTPDGGAVVVVYQPHEVDLSRVVTPRWRITQKTDRLAGILVLQASHAPRDISSMIARDPKPGDIVVLGKSSWVKYKPDLLRVDPHHWWLRLTRYQRGKEWSFLRAQRNCPIVIDVPVEDRDLDPILAKHIDWARQSTRWQDFLKNFDDESGGWSPPERAEYVVTP